MIFDGGKIVSVYNMTASCAADWPEFELRRYLMVRHTFCDVVVCCRMEKILPVLLMWAWMLLEIRLISSPMRSRYSWVERESHGKLSGLMRRRASGKMWGDFLKITWLDVLPQG